MADLADIKLAKRLALAVLEAGESRLGELNPALEHILAGRSTASRRQFLKIFHKQIVRELEKDTLTIESAEPLSEGLVQQVIAAFAADHPRPLQVVQKSDPELIAGMRVRLGDTVFDASLLGQLQILSNRIR